MKVIGYINEHSLSEEDIKKLPIHKKVRGVIFLNKNMIVCVEEKSHGIDNLLGLPGGTVENNEDQISAFYREVKEETGYEINEPTFVGLINLIRKDYISVTYCYKANIKGLKENIKLTSDEIEVNTHPLEINFKEAFDRINKEYNKIPNDNSLRSILIMKEILNN